MRRIDDQELLRLHAEGTEGKEIAARFHVSPWRGSLLRLRCYQITDLVLPARVDRMFPTLRLNSAFRQLSAYH